MTTLTTTSATADKVSSAITLVRQVLAEKYPTAATSIGSGVDTLIVQPNGYLGALYQERAAEAFLRSSLLALSSGMVAATDADIDALASNYFTTRKVGTFSTGYVQILTVSSGRTTFPEGSEFRTAGGTVFRVPFTQTAYPPGTVGVTASDTARLMVQRPLSPAERSLADSLFPTTTQYASGYVFTIKVEAAVAGSTSAIGLGTSLTLAQAPWGIVSILASDDFVPGTAAETNTELLARVQSGITAAIISGQEHSQRLLSNTVAGASGSFLGVSSALVTRGLQNILGVTQVGYIDAYIKTVPTVSYRDVTVSATVTNVGTKTLTFTLDRLTSAGVYRLLNLRRTSTTGVITSMPTPAVTPTIAIAAPFTPRVATSKDLYFSRNHTITGVFADTGNVAITTLGQVVTYQVTLAYMPNIEACAAITADSVRPAGADVLVKAAVPCFLNIAVAIRLPTGAPQPDTLAIQSAVAVAIQNLPFGTSQVTSFVVHKAVASALVSGEVTSVQFTGGIYAPSGVDLVVLPTSAVTVPEDIVNGVGAGNTFFSCSTSAVQVSFV
jgi:hypothetical protein